VIFLHGGTWVKGEKEDYRFVGAALAEAGYVAVLPNYRLYPQVRFPEFIQDGARAVLWAREHASEFGGDPSALFVMGHSAGAHIAASLALDSKYLTEVAIRAGSEVGSRCRDLTRSNCGRHFCVTFSASRIRLPTGSLWRS
jgi:acetyl esterase/lipase